MGRRGQGSCTPVDPRLTATHSTQYRARWTSGLTPPQAASCVHQNPLGVFLQQPCNGVYVCLLTQICTHLSVHMSAIATGCMFVEKKHLRHTKIEMPEARPDHGPRGPGPPKDTSCPTLDFQLSLKKGS